MKNFLIGILIILLILTAAYFLNEKFGWVDVNKLLNKQKQPSEEVNVSDITPKPEENDVKDLPEEIEVEEEEPEDVTQPKTDISRNNDGPKEEKDIIYSARPLKAFVNDYLVNDIGAESISVLITKEEEYQQVAQMIDTTININGTVHYRYSINGNDYYLTQMTNDRDTMLVVTSEGSENKVAEDIVKAYELLLRLNEKKITKEQFQSVKTNLRRYVKVIPKLEQYAEIPTEVQKGETFIDFTNNPRVFKLDKEGNVLVYSKVNDLSKLNLGVSDEIDKDNNDSKEEIKIDKTEENDSNNKEESKPKRRKKVK